jgi:hypothetical protein
MNAFIELERTVEQAVLGCFKVFWYYSRRAEYQEEQLS